MYTLFLITAFALKPEPVMHFSIYQECEETRIVLQKKIEEITGQTNTFRYVCLPPK